MDYRLIHGQVLVSWNSILDVNHIIVTNDAVAKDALQVTILKSVAPAGAKVSVFSVADCIAYCNSPKGEAERILVIVKYPEDALAVFEQGLKISTLNLGNQAYTRGSKKLSRTVFLTESGVRALKKVHDMGITITCRMMPDDSSNEYWPIIEKTFPDWLT
jgi:mannose/fructose/N-acetylgalactosamine-specific phosphotransferase system component IIB